MPAEMPPVARSEPSGEGPPLAPQGRTAWEAPGRGKRRERGRASPDDESSAGLQQLPLTAEPLQQVDHELVEVGVHGGRGGRALRAFGTWKGHQRGSGRAQGRPGWAKSSPCSPEGHQPHRPQAGRAGSPLLSGGPSAGRQVAPRQPLLALPTQEGDVWVPKGIHGGHARAWIARAHSGGQGSPKREDGGRRVGCHRRWLCGGPRRTICCPCRRQHLGRAFRSR